MKPLGVVAGVLLALAALRLALPFTIAAFVFRPTALPRADPHGWGFAEARLVTFPAADGARLTGWWAPPKAGAPVVLIAHGRSANISTRAAIGRRLSDDGFGVLLFDYRGYGASAGGPSERGLEEDAVSAFDWLATQHIGAGRIIVLGQSIGDAAAARVAATHPVAALVLVSPFTSLPEAAADRFGLLVLPQAPWPVNRFDVGSSLRRVEAPVVFVASRNDGLVSIETTRKAAALLRSPPLWLEDDRLKHDGMLAAVTADGRLTATLRRIAGAGSSVSGRSPAVR